MLGNYIILMSRKYKSWGGLSWINLVGLIGIYGLIFILIRGFMANLYEKKDKKSTIGRKLAAIRSFFQFCIKKRWLDYNPAKVVAAVIDGKSFISYKTY